MPPREVSHVKQWRSPRRAAVHDVEYRGEVAVQRRRARPSLQRLAEPTGGSVIVASTIREVEAAAQRVAEELRQQYTLGFYPQNAGDKTYTA